jgi:hypothetical protein
MRSSAARESADPLATSSRLLSLREEVLNGWSSLGEHDLPFGTSKVHLLEAQRCEAFAALALEKAEADVKPKCGDIKCPIALRSPRSVAQATLRR